ncbi:MAG: hypothetical protein JWR77_181 [Rhizorhabdus sp.]|nr:hypothetical protein [Rhizorhabdus sp.]
MGAGQDREARWRQGVSLARNLLAFGVTSGGGLLIDIGLFLLLTRAGLGPFVANLISATAGVTFVYFVSVRRIFRYEGALLLPMFLAYLGYQALAVAAASAGVALLVRAGMMPFVAKLAILPFTFSANYLFMRMLTGFSASRIYDRTRGQDHMSDV